MEEVLAFGNMCSIPGRVATRLAHGLVATDGAWSAGREANRQAIAVSGPAWTEVEHTKGHVP